MIELFNQYQTILIGIGVMISNVFSFFAGRRQRRINNFQKIQSIYSTMLDHQQRFLKEFKKDEIKTK